MSIQRYLLSTTALLGLGVMVSSPAQAQLDVSVSGFLGVRAHVGDAQEAGLDAHSFGLSNDTEVHVSARGTADNGIRYGATVEFEGDTDSGTQTDETWIFFGGDFGEIRLGDEDGASDNMKVTGAGVSAGTGGIDGAIFGVKIGPSNSSDDTKVRYDGSFGPVQIGVSYTPDDKNGNGAGSTDAGTFKDLIEAGVVISPNLGDGFSIKAGLVGGVGDDDTGDEDFETFMGGINVGFSNFTVGAGYGSEDWGGAETDWWNVGVAGSFGAVNASVTYGYVDEDATGNEPTDLALSADTTLMPGVVLAGDLHFFDRDTGGEDDGTLGVIRVRTAF